MTLENVIYMNVKNDVAFVVGVLNLFERQSAFSLNMPLRFLVFFKEQSVPCKSEKGYTSGQVLIRHIMN